MWNGLEGRDYFGEKCSAITALKFQRKLIHIRTYRNWGKSMTNIIVTDYLYHYVCCGEEKQYSHTQSGGGKALPPD